MQKRSFTTRQMALDAVLAAVCAVLGYYGPDLGNMKITFEGLPVILAALLCSPLDGAAVGGIGTLLYQLLRYGVTAPRKRAFPAWRPRSWQGRGSSFCSTPWSSMPTARSTATIRMPMSSAASGSAWASAR